MSEPQRDQPYDREPVSKESNTVVDSGAKPVDDRGGFRDAAPNPHDEQGAEQTAARATGAIAGMFFPVAIIAIVVIPFFVL